MQRADAIKYDMKTDNEIKYDMKTENEDLKNVVDGDAYDVAAEEASVVSVNMRLVDTVNDHMRIS